MNRIMKILSILVVATTVYAAEPKWKKVDVNAASAYESAGVLDVDNDGKLDIVCGEFWYKAPNWTKHPLRDVVKQGTYYNCFANLPVDANGDGKMDFITVSYFGKNIGWVENPGEIGKKWNYHEIDLPGESEAAWAVDLTGDGKLDFLPNTVRVVVWYELIKAGPKPEFKKHDFGKEAAGHGVGTGDVNKDGKLDLLTPKGWFEAPADPSNDTWTWHPEWNLGATGIQILARDFDGDGLVDLIWGNGHDYGLFWMKQGPAVDGKRTWTKHTIDGSIASVHTLVWADLDGDGKDDELVTGKRVYAHEIEPGATDGSFIGYFKFNKATGAWDKHEIYKGEPSTTAPKEGPKRDAQKDFAPGTAGTGLQMTAIDMDGDGDLDLVCPGKSGLYIFENLGTK